MSDFATALAKLAGVQKAATELLSEDERQARNGLEEPSFAPQVVQHYFDQAARQVEAIRNLRPDLYGDFHHIDGVARIEMTSLRGGPQPANNFARSQVERLVRDINQ